MVEMKRREQMAAHGRNNFVVTCNGRQKRRNSLAEADCIDAAVSRSGLRLAFGDLFVEERLEAATEVLHFLQTARGRPVLSASECRLHVECT